MVIAMNSDSLVIGVLALQGDFSKHIETLSKLGVQAVEVRKPEDLNACDGLILPGGESTVMLRQLDFIQLREPLLKFAKSKPVFGTCAGLILMSSQIQDSNLKPFHLLDIQIARNAFGRQIDSFEASVELHFSPEHSKHVNAFFIRAPRIQMIGKDVQILATYHGETVMVRQGHHLGATFHPELTESPMVHQYFLDLASVNKK